MTKEQSVDIKENKLLKLDSELITILLKDNSSGKNLIWATDDYSQRGAGYGKNDHISVMSITGRNGNIIKPRTEKSKQEQLSRVRDKAEVFTPSWICNKQNNLIDDAWFGKDGVFNIEQDKTWISTTDKIEFPENKTWQDYVKVQRLEITCGEAPYLASRYDAVTGNTIAVKDRIGLLDRKLRVVSENIDDENEWYEWAKESVKSVFGFDWQGDNVLLARENLLFTVDDYFEYKFGKSLEKKQLREIAIILSWNIWQMDGLKFVIPNSCHNTLPDQMSLFDNDVKTEVCEGCKHNNRNKHNGIYCNIMDWGTGKRVKFVSLVGRK